MLSMEEFEAAKEEGEELRKAHVDDTDGGFGGILGMKVPWRPPGRYIESFIS